MGCKAPAEEDGPPPQEREGNKGGYKATGGERKNGAARRISEVAAGVVGLRWKRSRGAGWHGNRSDGMETGRCSKMT